MIVGVLIAVTPSTPDPRIVSPCTSLSATSIPASNGADHGARASRCGCGDNVMKNWLPPVSAQSRAMPTVPRRLRPLVQLVANRDGPPFTVAARIAVLHDEVRDDAMDGHACEK